MSERQPRRSTEDGPRTAAERAVGQVQETVLVPGEDVSGQIAGLRESLGQLAGAQSEIQAQHPTFLQNVVRLQKLALEGYGFLIVDLGGSYGNAIPTNPEVQNYVPGAGPLDIVTLQLSRFQDISPIRDDGTKRDFDTIAFPAKKEPDGRVRLLSFDEVRGIGKRELKRRFKAMEHAVRKASGADGPDFVTEQVHYHLPVRSPIGKASASLSDRWHRTKEFVSSVQVYPPEAGGDPRGRITFRLAAIEQTVPWDTMQIVQTFAPDPSLNTGEQIGIYALLPHAEQLRYTVRTLEDKPQDLGKLSEDSNLGHLTESLNEYARAHDVDLPKFSTWRTFAETIHDPPVTHPVMRLKMHIVQWWFKKRARFNDQSIGEWASHNRVFNWGKRLIS